MYIGVLQIELYMSEPQSLKDKRRIIKSLIDKVQNKFNVSVAEIGKHDNWNYCQLGAACVSNEAGHSDRVLNSVINFIENSSTYEVTDIHTEIIPY